jgi:hypothetical protein
VSRPRPRSPSAAAAVLTLLVALVLPTAPASAHPAGEVPRARLAVEGTDVVLDWIAAPDDAAEVLVGAGIWPEEVAQRYLDVAFGGPADQLPTETEIRSASQDPALSEHLREHIVVAQEGRACPAVVHPTEDLLTDGFRMSFRCPRRPAQVASPCRCSTTGTRSYRSFSLDGTRRVAIHTIDEPTHVWDLARRSDHQAPPWSCSPRSREPSASAACAAPAVAATVTRRWPRAALHRRAGLEPG